MTEPKLTFIDGHPVYLWELEPTSPSDANAWPSSEIDTIELIDDWIKCDWTPWEPKLPNWRKQKRWDNRSRKRNQRVNKLKG